MHLLTRPEVTQQQESHQPQPTMQPQRPHGFVTQQVQQGIPTSILNLLNSLSTQIGQPNLDARSARPGR